MAHDSFSHHKATKEKTTNKFLIKTIVLSIIEIDC